jgi:uncharacterized Zn finger protein
MEFLKMIYEEDGDEIIHIGEPCPTCGSQETEYRSNPGFWKCESCSTVWDDDDDGLDDDPDSEDVVSVSGLNLD